MSSYEVGANYFIKGHEAKLQLGLGLFEDKRIGAAGSALITKRWQGTLAAQASF
jgi:hypothetical protein